MKVYDKNRTGVELGSIVGQGGEAKVYTVLEQDNFLVKLYKDPNIPGLEAKIEAMSSHNIKSTIPAWPKFPVYNERRNFIGFAMKSAEGKALSCLTGGLRALKDNFSHFTRKELCLLARDLVRQVNNLHQNNIMLSDYNPQNFFITPKAKLALIDCDSYQVLANGSTYLSQVVKEGLHAPELLQKDWQNKPKTPMQDRFACAMLVYYILVPGQNPFNHRGGLSPVENLRKGTTPLNPIRNNLFPKGPWHNLWQKLPQSLRKCLCRYFILGHNDPKSRPCLSELEEELTRYYWQLQERRACNLI